MEPSAQSAVKCSEVTEWNGQNLKERSAVTWCRDQTKAFNEFLKDPQSTCQCEPAESRTSLKILADTLGRPFSRFVLGCGFHRLTFEALVKRSAMKCTGSEEADVATVAAELNEFCHRVLLGMVIVGLPGQAACFLCTLSHIRGRTKAGIVGPKRLLDHNLLGHDVLSLFRLGPLLCSCLHERKDLSVLAQALSVPRRLRSDVC